MQIELSSIDVLTAFGFVVEHEENVYNDVLTIYWKEEVVFRSVVEWPDSVEELCQKWFVNKLLGKTYM